MPQPASLLLSLLHFPWFDSALMPQIHKILFIYIKSKVHKWEKSFTFWDWFNSQNYPLPTHDMILFFYDWIKLYCVYTPLFNFFQALFFWGISKQDLLIFPCEKYHLKPCFLPKFSSRLHAIPERSRILDWEENRKYYLPWSWIIRKIISLKLIVNVFSKISSFFKCFEIK